MKIVVASKNPVKISVAKAGFATFFEDVNVESCSVKPGISDQPMSNKHSKVHEPGQ